MTTLLDYAPPMEQDLITRAEAARVLEVSLQTVDRYAAEGMLERHKNPVTKRVKFRAADVERLRREREGTQ